MKENTKLFLIYGGGLVLASAFAYYIYSMKKNKPTVVEDVPVDEVLGTTPTPAPVKPNPFTALLGKPLPAFSFKPTDYSVKNPFADVNTAIADVPNWAKDFNVYNQSGQRLV